MIKQYDIKLDEKTIKRVGEILRSGQLAQGPEVTLLEKKFLNLSGTDHAIAVNSGTAALHVAMDALGVGPGDEVIVPAFTFVATANAVLMAGAEPVFADIDAETFNLDVESVEKMITPKTKAVIVVNLYGMPADWDLYRELAQAYKLQLVEDAAQSVESTYKGEKSGSLGHIGCFSFYATKNLMSGEGGMVTTNTSYLADRARSFRHHGQDINRRYTYKGLGYNYRMMDVQAAILLGQMGEMKKKNERRRKLAFLYSKMLSTVDGIDTPTIISNVEHVFHQYTIRVKRSFPLSRNQLQKYLAEKGIQSGVYYPKPLYKAEHLSKFRRDGRELLHTERAAREVLSLPIQPNFFLQFGIHW